MLGQLPPVLGIFGAQRDGQWAITGQSVGNLPMLSLWLSLLCPQGLSLLSNPFLPCVPGSENR